MTKKQNKTYNRYYYLYRWNMGIFWFGLFRKSKPIEAYGFWVESFGSDGSIFVPDKIPFKYVVDMFCEIVANSKVSYGKKWTVHSPIDLYFNEYKYKLKLQERSELLIKTLLRILSESISEKGFFVWYKEMKSLIEAIY